MTEHALTFVCAGERLVGVICRPQGSARVGVVVVVGGPQYRVGSHRQFLLLSRALAAAGIPVMRFDHRGMGDSTGDMRDFQTIATDIEAAIDAFTAAVRVEHVVLWGLCDAASAILLYWETRRDRRVAGIVLLNPWVRSADTLALTHVKHYYGRRLFEREFWANLTHGKVDVAATLTDFCRALKAKRSRDTDHGFQDVMAQALHHFRGPVLLLLSENDLTAQEFMEYSTASTRWRGVLDEPHVEQCRLKDADHTFSSRELRDRVQELTLNWLSKHFTAR